MKRILTLVLVLGVSMAALAGEGCKNHAKGEKAAAKAGCFGKELTVVTATEIAKVNSEPKTFGKESVLLEGKAVAVCQHAGCWVELEQGDQKIICKSVDESIHLPKDIVGKTVKVQGTVMYDEKAPGTVQEKHEGGEAHACPAPKVMLSIEGVQIAMAHAAGDAVPAVAPAAEEKGVETPATDKK